MRRWNDTPIDYRAHPHLRGSCPSQAHSEAPPCDQSANQGTHALSAVLFNTKSDGTYKVRIVVRGDLTKEGEHYIATKSSMVSLDTVRTIVALAAGSDMPLYTVDFTQAFLNADLGEPHVYCDLPELPPEMCGGEFGIGWRANVAYVHKAWSVCHRLLDAGE